MLSFLSLTKYTFRFLDPTSGGIFFALIILPCQASSLPANQPMAHKLATEIDLHL